MSLNVRECFVPRPGWIFAQADYEQLELHTLAELCIKLFGYSTLGDALNAGLDPHTELAAEIFNISPEEARRRRKDKADKAFDDGRQAGKVGNFGLPGGLGVKRFVDFARSGYGVIIAPDAAKKIKAAWLRRWPEMVAYFDYIATKTNNPEGLCTLVDPFTGRVRGGVGYTNGCNDGFQALGAAVAKEATWLVSRACYTGDVEGEARGASPIHGSRIVNMIHDELIVETPDTPAAHSVAKELERLMIKGADKYLPHVKAKAPGLLMRYWSKDAEACTDENLRLVPWEGAKCEVPGCVRLDKGVAKPTAANRRIRGAWFCGTHAGEGVR